MNECVDGLGFHFVVEIHQLLEMKFFDWPKEAEPLYLSQSIYFFFKHKSNQFIPLLSSFFSVETRL